MSVTLGEIIEERSTLRTRIAELEAQPAPQGVAEVMSSIDAYEATRTTRPRISYEAVEHAITAVITERDALRERVAELERDAKIGAAAMRAVKELPDGVILKICLEHDAGWLEMNDEFDPCADEPFEMQIHAAIDAAISSQKDAP